MYQKPPVTMLAAARKALDEHGFRVGISHRTMRGTWFVAELTSLAAGVDTSKGVGVLLRPVPGGMTRVSVVSQTTDTPAAIHIWIANALSEPAPQ